MALDPATRLVLDKMAAKGINDLWTGDVATIRPMFDAMSEASEHDPEHVAEVTDLLIPVAGGSLPARVYRPVDAPGILPVLLYFHGGGGVIGNIETHDSLCRTLANRSGCLTISVAYRLGPEHRFPTLLDDGWSAFAWARKSVASMGGDPERMAVGGDSAGGWITAVITQRARAEGGLQPRFQLLLYPAVDARRSPERYASVRDNRRGYFLSEDMIRWFGRNSMTRDFAIDDPRVSPLCTTDFSGLPPALVITAGFDPLRDEGHAYAEALAAAGVPVESVCFETTIHGFMSMGRFIPLALDALHVAGDALRRALAAKPGC
jgi:acetyl esterase